MYFWLVLLASVKEHGVGYGGAFISAILLLMLGFVRAIKRVRVVIDIDRG